MAMQAIKEPKSSKEQLRSAKQLKLKIVNVINPVDGLLIYIASFCFKFNLNFSFFRNDCNYFGLVWFTFSANWYLYNFRRRFNTATAT